MATPCGGNKTSQGIDLTNDKLAVQRLREAAETVKIEVASKVQADIKVPFITPFRLVPNTCRCRSLEISWKSWLTPCS